MGNKFCKPNSDRLSVPVALTKQGSTTRAQGSVALLRTDYNIGQGEWVSENYVKHAVNVKFDIVAKQ